jgi:hypothetical protein
MRLHFEVLLSTATSNYCVQLTAGRLVGVIATGALARRS